MKWKNYGLWVSLASILYMVFRDLGVQIDLTTWETYVTAVLGILATLGIVSNPEKGKGFFDKVPTSPTEAIAQVAQHLQDQGQQNQQTGSNLQNMNQPMENQQMGMPQQQSFQGQLHTRQSSQPLDSQTSFNQNNYTNTTPSSPQQSQTIEPTNVPTELYEEPKNADFTTTNHNSSDVTTHDRDSIHGMPPPPYERM